MGEIPTTPCQFCGKPVKRTEPMVLIQLAGQSVFFHLRCGKAFVGEAQEAIEKLEADIRSGKVDPWKGIGG